MARIKTWEVSDEFWAQAESLISNFKGMVQSFLEIDSSL
jgi:hypothetical protein